MFERETSFDTECVLAELSAAAAVISFWDTTTSPAVWITICLIVAIGINALGVGESFLSTLFPPSDNPP